MTAAGKLTEYLTKLAGGGLCVAFSGGVDSAILLKAACDISRNVHAVTISTLFHSVHEPEAAESFAKNLGASFKLIELSLPAEVLHNPKDRCYLCKKAIFSKICGYAEKSGLAHILDGTNADDLTEYRPGLRALSERGVKSPLAELGITKDQVRGIAREFGLQVADKPSSPCLATRIPYDTYINPEILLKIDEMETFLKFFGFPVVRARVHGDIVRIEVPPDKFADILITKSEITKKIRALGFSFVTLDLAGFRSGSFDMRQGD